MLCVAAWSVHHVGALAASFVSGGDDYLFILFDGNYQVRATTSPAAALAAAAAAICAPPLGMRCAIAAYTYPPPMALTGCCMRAALGSWGGVRQLANSEVAFCHSFSISCARCCFALLCLLRSVHEANLYRTVSVVRCTWA